MISVDFAKLSFLVVDDSRIMRRLLRALLQGYGARTLYEAENGAEGLAVFAQRQPDIVITDWMMPVLDGIEFTLEVRRTQARVDIFVPIIMLTAHSDKNRVLDARNAGVTEFLCKPVSAQALYARILNVVANPRPFIKTKTFFGPDHRGRTGAGASATRRNEEPAHTRPAGRVLI